MIQQEIHAFFTAAELQDLRDITEAQPPAAQPPTPHPGTPIEVMPQHEFSRIIDAGEKVDWCGFSCMGLSLFKNMKKKGKGFVVRLDEPVGVRNGNAEYCPRSAARGVFVGNKADSTARLFMFKQFKAAVDFLQSLKEDSTDLVAISQLYHMNTARAERLTQNQTDEGKKRTALQNRQYVANRMEADPEREAEKQRAHSQKSGAQKKARYESDEDYRLKKQEYNANAKYKQRLAQRKNAVDLLEDLRGLHLPFDQECEELERRAAPRLSKEELVGKVAALTSPDTRFTLFPVNRAKTNFTGQSTISPLPTASLPELCRMHGRLYVFGTIHAPFTPGWYQEARNRVGTDYRLDTTKAVVLDLAKTDTCADALMENGVEDLIQKFTLNPKNRGENTRILHGEVYRSGMGNGKLPTEIKDHLKDIEDASGFELEGKWQSQYWKLFRACSPGYVGVIFINEEDVKELDAIHSRANGNVKPQPGKPRRRPNSWR